MKRIISCFLCLIFLLNLASCSDVENTLKSEKFVAVKYASGNEIAAEEYVDFTKVTYNSSSDVVLAVENSKADYGILDDFELCSYTSAKRNIKKKEVCEYSIDYCAYFSVENEKLQNSFDKAIKDLEKDGTLEKIKTAHFNGKGFQKSENNKENGTLTMLCDPSFENRIYADDNGDVAGLDVDIAYEICNTLGYDLKIVTADFDELFIKLQDGEGDFIVSACEVNKEREEYYLSSIPYFTLNYYLIERK